jgi:hypothetical protein
LVVSGNVDSKVVFDAAQKNLSHIPTNPVAHMGDQLMTPYITPSMMA